MMFSKSLTSESLPCMIIQKSFQLGIMTKVVDSSLLRCHIIHKLYKTISMKVTKEISPVTTVMTFLALTYK